MSKLDAVARLLTFGDVDSAGIAAAGTTQATATMCDADHVLVTSATEGSAEGVILKAGNTLAFRTVTNGTTKRIFVYPPVGSNFNGATTNAGFNLNPNRSVWCLFLSTTTISANGW